MQSRMDKYYAKKSDEGNNKEHLDELEQTTTLKRIDKNQVLYKEVSSKELEDLIETANKKNLMIFEAMNLHYTPAFLSLKEDLKKLGDIKIVSFNYSQYSSRYNAFKEGTIFVNDTGH